MLDAKILDMVILALRAYADSGTPLSPYVARQYADWIEKMRAEEKKAQETRVTDGIHDVAPTPIEEQQKAYDEYARYSKLADWPTTYAGCHARVVEKPYRGGPESQTFKSASKEERYTCVRCGQQYSDHNTQRDAEIAALKRGETIGIDKNGEDRFEVCP